MSDETLASEKEEPRLWDHIRNPRQRAFLASYSLNARANRAAAAAGVHFTTPYYWRKNDEEFEKAWNEARRIAGHSFEEMASLQGEDGGAAQLIVMLKGLLPEIHRERYDHKMSGKVETEVKHVTLEDEAK